MFLYHFSIVDDTDFGLPSRLYRLSPQNGEIQKFTYAQVCARDLRRAQWPWNCQDATVDKLDPSLPTVCHCFTDTSSLGLSDEDFTTEIGFLNFVYGARIPPFHFLILACEGFAPSTPSLSASPGWLLPSTLCVCVVDWGYSSSNFLAWGLAEVRFYHPFSCMNSCHGAFTKSLALIDSLSASLLQTFCKNPGHEGSLLATLHLTSKNGGFYLPFSASNCAIRCHILLGESPSCAHMGFLATTLPPECGLRRFHSSDWVLELDLLYSQPWRLSILHCAPRTACRSATSLSLLAMVLICLVNCFTFSLANFPPFRVWHFHGLFSWLASFWLILVCVQLPYTGQTTLLC